MRLAVAVARAVGLAVAGLVVGFAAVAVHNLVTGLLLALPAVAATAVALPPGWSWRVPFAAGVVATVGLGTLPRGSGSYLVASNLAGVVLLGGTFAVLMYALLTARARPPAPAEESESETPVS